MTQVEQEQGRLDIANPLPVDMLDPQRVIHNTGEILIQL
jgi:hypothetical protein